jgi:hypothetical protein
MEWKTASLGKWTNLKTEALFQLLHPSSIIPRVFRPSSIFPLLSPLILWPQTSDLRPLSSHLPPPGRTAATKSAATTGKTAESTTPESAATHPETTAA